MAMTNDELDVMIRETHDVVLVMFPMVKDHDEFINGTGKAKLEIDRLKGFKRVSCWFFGVMIVATVGLITRFIYAALTG